MSKSLRFGLPRLAEYNVSFPPGPLATTSQRWYKKPGGRLFHDRTNCVEFRGTDRTKLVNIDAPVMDLAPEQFCKHCCSNGMQWVELRLDAHRLLMELTSLPYRRPWVWDEYLAATDRVARVESILDRCDLPLYEAFAPQLLVAKDQHEAAREVAVASDPEGPLRWVALELVEHAALAKKAGLTVSGMDANRCFSLPRMTTSFGWTEAWKNMLRVWADLVATGSSFERAAKLTFETTEEFWYGHGYQRGEDPQHLMFASTSFPSPAAWSETEHLELRERLVAETCASWAGAVQRVMEKQDLRVVWCAQHPDVSVRPPEFARRDLPPRHLLAARYPSRAVSGSFLMAVPGPAVAWLRTGDAENGVPTLEFEAFAGDQGELDVTVALVEDGMSIVDAYEAARHLIAG